MCLRIAREEFAASKERFSPVAGSPFSACASLALPSGHAKEVPRTRGSVSPPTQTVATRAAAAAPVGGGGGLGREELPLPPRACEAAGYPTPSPSIHAVADRRFIDVGTRPRVRSPVRRAGDPRSGRAVEVEPPPGGGVAPLPPHAGCGEEGGWGRCSVYALPFVAPVWSGGRQRWCVRPLVDSRAGPRLLLSPSATGSQAVGVGSVPVGRGSLDGRTVSANGGPCGRMAATPWRSDGSGPTAPPYRLATRCWRSWGEEARGGGRGPRQQRGRGSCSAPWRGAGSCSERASRGRVLACCWGMPCVGLITMTLDRH